MEDSKLYSTQDIEKLKEKIDSYKETLTTLKMGTSIEDYLFMKNEFEDLKKQIVHLEGLTETIDGKHSMQIKEYEEQVKQLSIHIESLNQAIEEMNQEILAVLNKLITVETNIPTDNFPTNVVESSVKNIALPSRKLLEKIEQTTVQPPLPTTEPSYKFLQDLAGKAFNMNNGVPFPPNNNPVQKQEERHFNQHYFQSINTHPSQIYNGLYRNTTAESTFHFKNAADTQGIPVSVVEANSLTAPIAKEETTEAIAPTATDMNITEVSAPPTNELNITEVSAPITNDSDITEASAPTTNELEIIEASAPNANDLEIIEASAPLTNELEITEASVPNANDLDIVETSAPNANDLDITETSTSIVLTSSIIQAEPSSLSVSNENIELVKEESIAQMEFNNQTEDIKEVVEEEVKKEKNSLFFNLFRRRN
ncbi:hypothetical protein ACIQXW_21300 [Lysinibacillus sp. NPDC097162]|uniref:hypothetical protein n=1 Tax=Lysinibacillus sp. NPDC097162 TaxID=3364140 RepID=UPI0037F7F1ED